MRAMGTVLTLGLGLILATGVVAWADTDPDPALLDSLAAWHHRSRPDRVDSLATPAIAAARQAGDHDLLRRLLLARGLSWAAFGRGQAAEPDLREALILATTAGDTLAMLRGRRWLSVSVGLQGRGDEAAALYDQLESLAAAARDSVHLGWAWTGQAYAYYLQGQSQAAADRYRQAARTLAAAGVLRGAMWARNGEGMARRQFGDFQGARTSFQRVLDLARAAGDERNQAVALDQLGRLALEHGDPGQAERMLDQARAIHGRLRHHRESLLSSIDLATVRQLMGQIDGATSMLTAVRDSCRAHGLADLEVVAVNRLADLALDQERPAAAAALCRSVLRPDMPSAMADTEVRLRLSRSLAARDRWQAALAVLPAKPGAASLQLQVAAQRGRLLVAAGRPDTAITMLETAVADHPDAGLLLTPVLTVLGRARLAAGRPAAALSALESAADLWTAGREAPLDPRWRERRGAQGAELFSLMVSAHLASRHPRGVHDALAQVQRYKACTLRERLQIPRVGVWPLPADPPEPGEVLLEVIQGPDRSHLFGLTADTLVVASWRGPDTRQRLRRLRTALTSPAVTDPAAAQALAATILDSLPAVMKQALGRARTVIWCPDGDWHDLPLALLAGRPGWLSSLATICRAPSASVWAGRRRRSGRGSPPPTRLVAMHGPLPGATAECRWLVATYQDARCVVEGPADLPSLVDPHTGVLHLAAHVDTLAGWPWQASLALGAGTADHLGAADVAGMPLDLPLVVLAGCKTTGVRLPGEGLLGLASAFMVSGAGAVVATLWEVDDQATVAFSQRFYAGLEQGLTAAAALAQARARCRADSRLSAPCHWAGFVLLGDGQVTVPLERRPATWPIGIVALALAGVLLWVRFRVMSPGSERYPG